MLPNCRSHNYTRRVPSQPVLAPFAEFPEIMDCRVHDAILDWTLANADKFQPALITDQRSGENVLNPERRNALTCRDFDEIRSRISTIFENHLAEIVERLRFRGDTNFEYELELSAYGDGAHFIPHVDITLGRSPDRAKLDNDRRQLSAIYYYHRRPKGFSGGRLKLFGFPSTGSEEVAAIEIEPEDNKMVVFPSWVPHQVQPVSCPGKSFKDYRFAVNCWFLREDQ